MALEHNNKLYHLKSKCENELDHGLKKREDTLNDLNRT